jgi:hypothetical protein
MMRVLSATLVAFFAFIEVVICGDNIHGSLWSRRYISNHDVVVAQRDTTLKKRFDGATFTYYAAGLGACGIVNSASDFIVALNAAQFDGGTHCFETITITVDGKSTQAQITDKCMSCPWGGLDFTSGLFTFFAPESLGVLSGSWVFGGAASPSTTSTPTPSWTSTSTYQPPPSSSSSVSQYITSNSTSTQTPTPTPTPTPTSTQSSTSISATPTPSQEKGNIANLYLILIQFQSILAVANRN